MGNCPPQPPRAQRASPIINLPGVDRAQFGVFLRRNGKRDGVRLEKRGNLGRFWGGVWSHKSKASPRRTDALSIATFLPRSTAVGHGVIGETRI
jgi:hypothetical protein